VRPLRLSDIVTAMGGRRVGDPDDRTPRAIGNRESGLGSRQSGCPILDFGFPTPDSRFPTPDSQFLTGVSIDTRTLEPGEVFVALRGDRFDGHDFVDEALTSGAAAVIVDDERALPRDGRRLAVPFVLVTDTVEALGRLAASYRSTLGGLSATIIAVTGSNGKTTTKEMIFQALSSRGPAVRSIRSFNNHIGVPLTVLSIEETHRWAVLEMGTSAPGEIRALAAIARPDVGLVTNVAETHLAGLGSRDGVARAKGELIHALPAAGTAVLNIDDSLCAGLAALTNGRVIFFGRSRAADVFATDIRETADGVSFRLNDRRPVRLRVLGEHNALNAAAAIAVCRRLGLAEDEIAAALERLSGVPLRLRIRRGGGVTVLDDTYNANPQSMRGALGSLTHLPCEGRRVLVCGDMRELAAASKALHRDLGSRVAATEIHLLITVGEEAQTVGEAAAAAGFPADAVHHAESTADAVALVPALLEPGDLVLVKGSRAMRLERVVEALVETEPKRAAG